ncbi:hypothetical protein CPC08DRAFT_562871 [Agrocybe pediades]|nr:hypothetical protein CPC08DRAFT_562871 [Agrocybe pediades]
MRRRFVRLLLMSCRQAKLTSNTVTGCPLVVKICNIPIRTQSLLQVMMSVFDPDTWDSMFGAGTSFPTSSSTSTESSSVFSFSSSSSSSSSFSSSSTTPSSISSSSTSSSSFPSFVELVPTVTNTRKSTLSSTTITQSSTSIAVGSNMPTFSTPPAPSTSGPASPASATSSVTVAAQTSTAKRHLPVAVPITLGVVLCLLAIVTVILVIRSRRRRRTLNGATQIMPFDINQNHPTSGRGPEKSELAPLVAESRYRESGLTLPTNDEQTQLGTEITSQEKSRLSPLPGSQYQKSAPGVLTVDEKTQVGHHADSFKLTGGMNAPGNADVQLARNDPVDRAAEIAIRLDAMERRMRDLEASGVPVGSSLINSEVAAINGILRDLDMSPPPVYSCTVSDRRLL